MFLEIEAGLTVLAVVLAFAVPKLGWRWFEVVERSYGEVRRKAGVFAYFRRASSPWNAYRTIACAASCSTSCHGQIWLSVLV